MATMNSGLGGPAGNGENVFSSATKASGDNDDGSVQVDVTSVFSGGIDFFGTTYTDLYINSNGLIFHLLEINHRLPAGPLQRIC